MRKLLTILVSLALVLALGACSAGLEDEIATANASRSQWSISGSTFTHDPSIIYEKSAGLYWMFYTADGIGVKYSSDGKNWNQGQQVLGSKLSWWSQYVPSKTDFNIWAPEIVYYNGNYWLYYSVSTFGSRQSCIGLMKCSSILKGDWSDQGKVINSTNSSKWNCIDPAFIYDGAPYLAFGSWSDGIYMVRLSSSTMKPNSSSFTQIADRDLSSNAIEGASIWKAGNGYFYLLCSYDKCCAGTSSTYNIRYGRSKSALGPYLDKNGKSLCDNGGTTLLSSSGNRIGPGGQCIFETKTSGKYALGFHYYNKAKNGEATLGIFDIKTANGGWLSF